jgi:MerR family redox-sensitive transcriptional activator SoxR
MDSYDWHEAGLTVGQVADRSGARPSALRFYERQGLISTDRTAGNQRRYRGDVLCRVAMIRLCQQAGLSLAQIRAALAEAVPDGQVPGPQHWERLAQHLRRELRTHIHDLNRLLGELGSDVTPPAASAGWRQGSSRRRGYAWPGSSKRRIGWPVTSAIRS